MRPWYPFYPNDYERDTKLLSPMADLVYRRLLDFYWQNQAPLPNDVPAIARAIRLDTRVVKRYLHGELSGFWVTSDASISNVRMDAEIEKSNVIQEARGKAGKAGGLAKAKANAKANAVATALAPQSQSHIEEKIAPKVAPKKKSAKKKITRFIPPKLSDVVKYAQDRKSSVNPKKFHEYFTVGEWKDANGRPVKNWKQKFLTWEKLNSRGGNNGGYNQVSRALTEVERVEQATGREQASAIIDITPHGHVVGEDDEIVWP